MSLTQSNLNKYFKVKKQTSNSFAKDGKIKGKNYNVGKISSLETIKKNLEENEDDLEENEGDLEGKEKILEENENKLEERADDDSLEGKTCTIPCKLEEKPLEENTECTNTFYAEEETEVHIPKEENYSKELHQLLTPPLKQEQSERPSRKRKREQEHNIDEASPSKTPKNSVEVSSLVENIEKSQASTPVAKKRLILNREDDDEGEAAAAAAPAPKPLDPKTMKEKLGKCGRLDQLREKLIKMGECERKLQEFRCRPFGRESPKKLNAKGGITLSYKSSTISPFTSPTISPYTSPLKDKKTNSPIRYKNFSSLDIEVPVSPSKLPRIFGTPTKYSYERFKHLADPSADQLHLPYRYQVIKEVFRAVDTVVSILHNRQEIITYSKLKPAVQEMLRKTFSETHLGQLKTVFPLAYFFSQEKLRDPSYAPKAYHLTVKPNLDHNYKFKACNRNLLNQLNNMGKIPTSKFRKMDSVVLVERRDLFHMALLDIVKKHHSNFLSSLNPPITIEGPIRHWHPEFPIEDLSPPPPAELPLPPKSDGADSAKEVLDKNIGLFSVNNRMKEAIETVSKSSTSSSLTSSVKKPPLSEVKEKEIAACLKGISSSLLEKIRAKEAAKAAREMTRSSSSSQELETLSRLPELVRILRSLFVMEKKAALPWEAVMTKVVSSHSGSLSLGEVEKHIKMLINEVPGWCTSHKVRSGLYLKLDKNRQISDVIDKLNDVIKSKQ